MDIKEETSGWKVVLLSCVLATLVVLAPILWFAGLMLIAHYDVRRAQDEFKRTVNPEELRAWFLAQHRKHPEGEYSREAAEEWPQTFPRFAASRGFIVYLTPSSEAQDASGTLRGFVVWNFSCGEGLKVAVWLNPDGTPFEAEDQPPWSQGVTFQHLHK